MVFRDITEKRAVNKMIRLAQDSNLQKELKMFKIYVIFSHFRSIYPNENYVFMSNNLPVEQPGSGNNFWVVVHLVSFNFFIVY